MNTSPADFERQCEAQIADEARFERAREEVISYLRLGSADIEDLIPMLDGEGTRLLCAVLLGAYEEGCRRLVYTGAEQLVDALAQAEADREAKA